MGAGEAIMVGGYPLSGILQGARYKVTRLGGWWERPGIKREDIARERADGDFPTPWSYEARHVAIDGVVTTRSHEQQHHIADQLLGLCATGREWLTVQGHGATQSALVEADEARLIPITGTLARFELRFKASDPRKVGALYTDEVSSAKSQHMHLGNYPASPVISVTSALAPGGFSVNATYGGRTRRWEYLAGAWTSQAHIINMQTGRHFVDGVEQPGRLGRAELWAVPPGAGATVQLAPLVEGEYLLGEIEYRDTWI